MTQKAKLDLSSLPDNFREDYQEIVQDILRLKGKYETFSHEIAGEFMAGRGKTPRSCHMIGTFSLGQWRVLES